MMDPHNAIGLIAQEVEERRRKFGWNELPTQSKNSLWQIIGEVLKEPMLLLLVACGSVYFFLGDTVEAIMLLGFVVIIMGITIYQENKTEHALEALRNLASPRAFVIRDGRKYKVAGRELVPDDLIVLEEGDRVPADATILWSTHLSVDESLLTGESLPVEKYPTAEITHNIIESHCRVFSGSMVVGGQAVAQVLATGRATELGKIGVSLGTIAAEDTLLQRQTKKIVRSIFTIAIILCSSLVIIYGFWHHDWLSGILSGLTLAMAILPEEFPVVLTIFLALGAWRMSRHKVLTRRVAAVETLGAATVLCTDKTGTITQNKMSVLTIWVNHQRYDFSHQECPEVVHPILEYAILASRRDPFDPMEKALLAVGHASLEGTEHLHATWPLSKEYPLTRGLLALSHVWQKDQEFVVAAKGAPEAILDLAHVSPQEITTIMTQVTELAKSGLRIIGVAKASFQGDKLPENQHDFCFEFLGLIGFADPVRPGVVAAVKECHEAGIRTVMITGDYAATATRIGQEIGLNNPEQVILGSELEKMEQAELLSKIKTTNIFARVIPEQKLKIVEAFKQDGGIVGMTGDGINDAPALKSAHIGVAMGEHGTDVAREAADLVLLDDNFSSLVHAVRLGRRIFDNLKKAMAYIVSIHIPIAGLSLLPVLFGWPILLYPVHIVFLELIIDPACSVVFEAEEEENKIMQRPPRAQTEPLFGRRMLFISLLQGFISLVLLVILYYLTRCLGLAADETRTLVFVSLVISNLFLIFTNRSWSKNIAASLRQTNKALRYVAGGTVFFLILALYLPPIRTLFHFSYLSFDRLLFAGLIGMASVFWFEILKMLAAQKRVDLLKN